MSTPPSSSSLPRDRLDTNSKIIMNSITEEDGGGEGRCNGTATTGAPTAGAPYDSVGKNSVIANQVAELGPESVQVIVTEPEQPKTLPRPPVKKGPLATSTPVKPEQSTPQSTLPQSTPQSTLPQQESVEVDEDPTSSKFFPSRPLKYSELIELPVREKQKVARKLPVPKSSRATSPSLSDTFSSSSKL